MPSLLAQVREPLTWRSQVLLALWGKGFENSSKPLPLRQSSVLSSFPTSLVPQEVPRKSRDLSYLVISPAGTLQLLTLAGWLSLARALLQPREPLTTAGMGQRSCFRIAPQKLSRVHGFETWWPPQAEQKGTLLPFHGGTAAVLPRGLSMGTLRNEFGVMETE